MYYSVMLTVWSIVWGAENCALHDSPLNDDVPEAPLNEQTNYMNILHQCHPADQELNLDIERWNPPLLYLSAIKGTLLENFHFLLHFLIHYILEANIVLSGNFSY